MANVQLGTKGIGETVKIRGSDLYGSGFEMPDMEFLIVHQGKPGPEYDNSCNGTWAMLAPLSFSESEQFLPEGGASYRDTDVVTVSSDYKIALGNFSKIIKNANIPYIAAGAMADWSIQNIALASFHLSATEIGIPSGGVAAFSKVGSKLDYFIEGTSTEANFRRTFMNGEGTPTKWITRTQTFMSEDLLFLEKKFVAVNSDGSPFVLDATQPVGSCSPYAFILESSLSVDEDGFLVLPDLKKPIPCIKY